jgi:hypothetical protein
MIGLFKEPRITLALFYLLEHLFSGLTYLQIEDNYPLFTYSCLGPRFASVLEYKPMSVIDHLGSHP